jgi:iron-sulfur cluster assembly protein
MAYVLEYVDATNEDDSIFEDNDVKIIIGSKSIPYVNGMTLDYKREGLNEGFKFLNPNERDRCGCGESFRV